jgi:hypothetical protein
MYFLRRKGTVLLISWEKKFNYSLLKSILTLNRPGSGAASNHQGPLIFDLGCQPIARRGDEINQGPNSPPLVARRVLWLAGSLFDGVPHVSHIGKS